MRQVPFEHYELEGEMLPVPVLGCTGLNVIPGCEQTTENPMGKTVTFEGKEYRNYSIDPMGVIILGNDAVYGDKLSQDKLLPETTFPRLCPFLQYQQVTGCGGTGVWSFLTANKKWVTSWNRIQRIDYDGSGARPFLYYQVIYDYVSKTFKFSYKEAETSPDRMRPTQRGSISANNANMETLDLDALFKNVSFDFGEAEVAEPGPPIEVTPPEDTKPPVDPILDPDELQIYTVSGYNINIVKVEQR